MERHPSVHIFPSDDEAFREFAFAAIDEHGPLSAESLEAVLTERYPAARVRPRDPRGANAGDEAVWYVFRDGGVVPR